MFHVRQNCIQKIFGYNDFYDFVFDTATDISSPLKYEFKEDNGYKFGLKKHYVVWAWKANYLNLGAGCEVGLYHTFGSTKHYLFTQPMFKRLNMSYGTEVVNRWTYPKGLAWWITTFDSRRQDANASDIGVRCTAHLAALSEDARKAFKDEVTGDSKWKIKENKGKGGKGLAIFTWNYKKSK